MTASIPSEAKCFLSLTAAGLVRVSFPYDAVTNAQLQKIRPRGNNCGSGKGWEFPLAAAPILKDQLRKRFLIDDKFSNWLYLLEHPLPSLPSTSEILEKADFVSQLFDGRSFLPHQILGAQWLISRRGALLADEMGLGKTITSLLAARSISQVIRIAIMVIAPKGLHQHWRNEANALGIKINLYSWSKIPNDLSDLGTLLIVDEAHFAQSLYSKRTNALLRLSRHPRLRFIWLLTGTPLKNGRPHQIYPLLAAIQHPIASNKLLFDKYFCGGHWTNYGEKMIWDTKGVENLKELSSLIKPIILHRRKINLLELPPKIRKKYTVKLSLEENKGLQYRIKLIVDNYRYRVQLGLAKEDAETLAVLGAIRQITAEFKLSFVSNFLSLQLQQRKSVVLFSNFLQPLYLLNKYHRGIFLTGQQTIKEREKIVTDFQLGKINLLLCTYRTAGFGFTLHQARDVILLDRPWSPGDLEQAEDRCHRIGMKGELVSHWIQLGLIDQFIDSLLINKNENINIVLDSHEINIKRESLYEMSRSFLKEISNIYL